MKHLLDLMKQYAERHDNNISLVLHEDSSGEIHNYYDLDYNPGNAIFFFDSLSDLESKLKQ
jgi:hypothetical protein